MVKNGDESISIFFLERDALKKIVGIGTFSSMEKTFQAVSSDELTRVFKYIETTLLSEYPSDKITTSHFVFAILSDKETRAYNALSRTLVGDAIEELKTIFLSELHNTTTVPLLKKQSSYRFTTPLANSIHSVIEQAVESKNPKEEVCTDQLLCAVLMEDPKVKKIFNKVGLTAEQLKSAMRNRDDETSNKPFKHNKSRNRDGRGVSTANEMTSLYKVSYDPLMGGVFTDLLRESQNGLTPTIVHRDDIANEVLITLTKKEINNVILIGEHGVGRTSVINNIVNLIRDGKVPQCFKKLRPLSMDINKYIINSRSDVIDNKTKEYIKTVSDKENLLFVFDDMDLCGNMNGGLSVLQLFLEDSGCKTLCVVNNEVYNNAFDNGNGYLLTRHSRKIVVEELSEKQCLDAVNVAKKGIESFHEVNFAPSAITDAFTLSKRYGGSRKNPISTIDILDYTAAMLNYGEKESKEMSELHRQLSNKIQEKVDYESTAKRKDYNIIDGYKKEIDAIKSNIGLLEKAENMAKKPKKVTSNHIRQAVSKMVGIPLADITTTERERLKGLNDNLNSVVIGQKEAVDEVCRVIKRQRLGLSNPKKPAILFFGGATGTGKSYLAKKIAERIFGDEKYLVQLDMSEYNEKMSVNKLYGSSAGYVGYEQGGLLTSAIKQKKHCVLLLDEIEKADSAVHDVFLQVFEDGQLTDNKGVVIDFKDVIVIMTSNVGATEVANRGGGIGFQRNEEDYNKGVIEKALKKKFKPEFINRIDKIVYFNQLTDENLRDIVKLEVEKVNNRLKGIGYSLDSSITDGEMVDDIAAKVKEQKEFGARPILRAVQSDIEDKIADLIIEGDVKKGHVFKLDELR